MLSGLPALPPVTNGRIEIHEFGLKYDAISGVSLTVEPSEANHFVIEKAFVET